MALGDDVGLKAAQELTANLGIIVTRLNKETLPAVDQILTDRIEQARKAIATDLAPVVSQVQDAVAQLTGLTLNVASILDRFEKLAERLDGAKISLGAGKVF